MIQCVQCGSHFARRAPGGPVPRYCSGKCQSRASRAAKRTAMFCVECRTELKPRSGARSRPVRFCSHECARRSKLAERHRQRAPKQCLTCGAELQQRAGKRSRPFRFCSRKCQYRAHADELRAWWRTDKGRACRNRLLARARMQALMFLGGRCAWPGCTWNDDRALQIDHVNSDGYLTKHTRLTGGQRRYYRDVMKRPQRYQVLCANHNWVKRWEQSEHDQYHGPRSRQSA